MARVVRVLRVPLGTRSFLAASRARLAGPGEPGYEEEVTARARAQSPCEGYAGTQNGSIVCL